MFLKFLSSLKSALGFFGRENVMKGILSISPKWTKNEKKFRVHPKIWCSNFKPQYRLNYSSPTNDLQRVGKKAIWACKLILKLLSWLGILRQKRASLLPLTTFQCVSKHARVGLTQTWYQWDEVANLSGNYKS